VHDFAQRVGTIEKLKMLDALHLCGYQSRESEALTTFKAEMLWQLYARPKITSIAP